jgi:hypothetical protein
MSNSILPNSILANAEPNTHEVFWTKIDFQFHTTRFMFWTKIPGSVLPIFSFQDTLRVFFTVFDLLQCHNL